VNCGAIPGELFESEFFGHARGAFTGAVRERAGRFELAHGGTILLDEVGEIPLAHQAKLLRVLQEGTFERVGEERTRRADVRVLAATNRDLRRESESGRFRPDLYYRLSVFPIDVPPLRERADDIADLVRVFVARAAERLRVPLPAVPARELEKLRSYSWPGNVRELQHVVERAVILARDGVLFVQDLRRVPSLPGSASGNGSAGSEPLAGPDAPLPTFAELRARERDVIAEALRRCEGKVAGTDGAAALLGVPVTTLDSRIGVLGLRGHGRPAPGRRPR
jgi:transcriptional regulator with GAF, ATPase, and Fis domain